MPWESTPRRLAEIRQAVVTSALWRGLLEPAGPPWARNGVDAWAAGGHENRPSDPPRLRPKYTRCAARRPMQVEIGAASPVVVDWQFYIRYTQSGPRRICEP